MSTIHQLLQVNILHLPTSPLKVHLPLTGAKDLCPDVDINCNFLGFDVNGNYLEVDINGNFIGTDINGNLLGDNPNDNVPPDKPFKLARAVPDGQGAVPVNLQGQFPTAESPCSDYSKADMPKAYNPWAHNDPFFIGGRRKYRWNFVRPPNPKVQISLTQTHTIGGKEFKWDSSLPPDELDSFICTSSTEDSKECSEITGGKAYSWDFHLAPSVEVSSPSCPFT